MTADERAAVATVHSLLNCYLRETSGHDVHPAHETPLGGDDEGVHIELPTREGDLFVRLAYRSPTGRHRFDLPVLHRTANDVTRGLSYVELATLLATDLASDEPTGSVEELLLHLVQSKRAIERSLDARDEPFSVADTTFREAEQSLVFGHQFHPTPKSRSGIAPHDRATYAPELGGSFPLHYFSATRDLITQYSARDRSAGELVEGLLRSDPTVERSVVDRYVDGDRVLVPAHPWQADYLLAQSYVQAELGSKLRYHGAVGREFFPTSSVRTLYSPDAPFMVKGSLNVRITNSTRVNKARELDRGVAIVELLETDLGSDLARKFPAFDVIRDPASLTVDVGPEAESGFEVVLRENPFRGSAANVLPVVALCQDGIGDSSRLQRHIEGIAEREQRSTATVSEDWFQEYLSIAVRPVLWLYLSRGLGLEAHQQNSVLALDDAGYPERASYRDNQGFFFPESRYGVVDDYLPGVGERTDTIRSDDLTDEAIEYYVFINNVFGVVNAFGRAGLVSEARLLDLVRAELDSLGEHDHAGSNLLSKLLTSDTLTCKANLLMRFRDVDELTGSLETQILTTEIDNPLT